MGRTVPYGPFIGLDATNDMANMNDKYLAALEGGHVDIRGQIIKGDGIEPLGMVSPNLQSTFVHHYGKDDFVFNYANGANTGLATKSGAGVAVGFTGSPIINATNYNDTVVMATAGQYPRQFNGTVFSQNTNMPQGGAVATILKRLAVADIPGAETEIRLNVLNNENDYTTVSAPIVATDSAIIDVRNELTSNDMIKGLGVMEGDKLAVFCENETILYSGSEDITEWSLIKDFRVPIGIFGRNTIQKVGNDLFFCSKFGVHSLRRAASGLTLETINSSRIVDALYQELVEQVPSGKEPTAAWDNNLGHYNVYFPTVTAGSFDKLTYSYEPRSNSSAFQSWSYTPGIPVSSASQFAGELIGSHYTDTAANLQSKTVSRNFRVLTPVLWQGTPQTKKQYMNFYLRASGDASFTVNIYNDAGGLLQSTTHTPRPATDYTGAAPITETIRPIEIKCRHQAYGLQIQISSSDDGELKILDYALEIKHWPRGR